MYSSPLYQKLLDLNLHPINQALQLRRLIRRNRTGNYRPRHPARPSQGDLARHEYVRHVLVLAQEGKVEEDFDGFGIGGHDDDFADAAV
mmetsp:Transcript_6148/g.13455  ORF Transcript_6148/g.13455 Transcript_6148/m.13455 type:complete len:89 (-) Transcript_6148:347-613(-)